LPGPQGLPGTGSSGPAGPPIYLEAEQGDDGERGAPGLTGATGAQGAAGINGAALFFTAEDGIDGDPGPVGPRGLPGAAGASGIIYPYSMADGDIGNDEGFMVPPGLPIFVGRFTATITGCTNTPSGQMTYTLFGPFCALTIDNTTVSITSVSNSTAMSLTGLPACCRPVNSQLIACSAFNNNANVAAAAYIGPAASAPGNIDFYLGTPNSATNLNYAASGFLSTGVKGVGRLSIMYPLY